MNVTLCRACLKSKGKVSLKNQYNGESLSIHFFNCTGVKVIAGNNSNIPHSICDNCFDKLKDLHSFRLLCIKSDFLIKQHIAEVEKSDAFANRGIFQNKEKGTISSKDKSLQELYYSDDFQFMYKPKQKKKRRLTKHVCEVCGYCSNDSHTLKLHSNIHASNAEKTYSCHLCLKRFSSSISLKSHIARHNTTNSLICEECGHKFSTLSHLRVHKKNVHVGLRPYKCDLCSRAFALRSNLTVHQKIHSGIKPHKCSTCGRGFTTTSDLKGHMRSHSGEKPYICDVCNKGFSLRSNLSVHKQIHFNNNPFKCTDCDRKFSSKASLKVHLKIHSGIRNYACSICHARFTHSNTLKLHQTVHTGRRDHACTHCDKKFSRLSTLRAHIKRHNFQVPNSTSYSENISNATQNNSNDTCCAQNNKMSSHTKISYAHSTVSPSSHLVTEKISPQLEKHIPKSNSANHSIVSISNNVRSSSVIESVAKSDNCVSGKQKFLVEEERINNVPLGATNTISRTYLPIGAIAHHIKPIKVQTVNGQKSQHQDNIFNDL